MTGGNGRPLRILHAIARLNLGGAAQQVLELAAGQRRRGHEVLVLHGRLADGEKSMAHIAGDLGVPERYVAALGRELSFRDDIAAVRTLRAAIRAFRPDVIHTHAAKAGATGRIAALLAGRGGPQVRVHTFHGHVLRGYFSARRERAFALVERWLARSTSALVAISEEVRADLVGLRVAPAERFEVVLYGFDFSGLEGGEGALIRRELGIDDNAFVVGFAGRLTAIKRPLDLVRALPGVPATLVLLGDGELRPQVEALARELGVEERIRLAGWREGLADWYAAFDVLALTSANEGTPVAAIEALAAGRPVVATDVGGTSTVIQHGETGFLVPVGDVDALATRLRELAADPTLRAQLGQEGARRVRETFGSERMIDDVERLYRRLLADS
jgi:glycosyltransferase involved in cell wall biosynthesis